MVVNLKVLLRLYAMKLGNLAISCAFEPEVEKPIYGLVANINTNNPIKIAYIEWYNLLKDVFTSNTSLTKRILYFLKPPGWKHDGTGKLSGDLRQQWEENKKGEV